jgi:hypothetical protein
MNLLDDKKDDQVQIDPNIDALEELTKPGGKFDKSKYQSDADMYKDIAKSKLMADQYIDHMKARQDELRQDYVTLREQYNAGPKLKELIDQYQAASQNNNQAQLPSGDDVKPVSFDPKDIETILEQKLTAREQLRREEANYKTVESKLTEHYGSNYQSVLKQQVDQLGLDKDFVNELARKHPQVLFRTLGLEGQKTDTSFQAPLQSSQRRDPFGSTEKRTNAYYQKLRKSDPVAYRSPKIQDQMFKDMTELGEAFEDGDWNAYGHRY